MRFTFLVSLILWVNPIAFASSTAALKILEQADELAGDNPKASLELLASLDKTIPSSEIDAHLRKNILKCEILVDNDDPREALKISESPLRELNVKSELGLKMRLCRSSALEGVGESVKAETELIKILSESRNEGFREVEGQAHLKLGQIQSFKNQFSSSLNHLTSAKQIFSLLKLAHKERITLNSIAVLYGRMGENAKAITYFEEVLAQNKSLGKNRNIAVVLYNIGRRYEDLKNYDKALAYLNDSLKIHSEMKNEKSLAVVERALGGVYNSLGKPEEALKHLTNALGTLERKNLVKSQAQLHLELGKTYTLMKKPKEALASLAKAEELNVKSFSQQLASDIFQARSQIYESTGQWKQAYESLSQLKKSSDSLFKMKADEQLSRMNALFDVEMLQKELSNSQRIQNLQLLALALAAGLLIFGVFFTIKQIKMARTMRALALTDEMTKIPNRRHIIEYGKQMLNTCQRQDKALSVVIFDIDHFKKINDTFGHAVGDEVIKKVAFIGRNSLRQEDMIGRIGGEEFLAILPFTGAEAAKEVAERIRLQIQKYNFSNISDKLQVTVSVGVVTQELPRSSVSLDQLIHDADEALYNVKQNGRNGVSLRLIS
ncbi:MAG: diguanylate cyclase [Pseudobdellovibrio sp.]|nr:diguanylate cyclase [Pseudobdellovibrio sp.]